MSRRQKSDVYDRAENIEALIARGRLLHGQAILAAVADLRRRVGSLWRRCFRRPARRPFPLT